jgi:sirohydrochlorin cobaltochelatase
MRAIILFAHGARDPEWAQPFQRIRALAQQRLPEATIRLAFLEVMKPDLASAIEELVAAGVQHFSVVPLFMAQGGHLRQDVPHLLEQIKQRHPRISVRLTSPIGEVEPILQQIAEWIVAESKQP